MGVWSAATIAVTRQFFGTGMPVVDITNVDFTVISDISGCSVRGTNNLQIVGDMWISNAMNGAVSSFPASASWISAPIPLILQTNRVYVYGSNVFGAVTNDAVMVVGIPEASGICAMLMAVMVVVKRRCKK